MIVRLVLSTLLLAACDGAQRPPAVAVDRCILSEYLQECDSELATPEEQAQCRTRAPQEATRVLAGIPLECRS